ncbi:Uncharacterised protein [Rodentibacter pneumotropicus]|uniref:Uncharacterized protein n=1 Tax=Rodentibacter pneumotropicus TaxID=758 RepID=A0A3S4UP78_9PAST|nr:Uncharacterised protein [Rodentibacter pneumotropicus]
MELFSNKSFNAGLKDSISFGLAFIFLYVPIGALGASQGLGLSEVMATSILSFQHRYNLCLFRVMVLEYL